MLSEEHAELGHLLGGTHMLCLGGWMCCATWTYSVAALIVHLQLSQSELANVHVFEAWLKITDHSPASAWCF